MGTSIVLAILAISRNRVRSALTVLGILIGVAALIIVTTLATGVSKKVTKSLDSFATNSLSVTPQWTSVRGRQSAPKRLLESDARAITRDADAVVAIAPILNNQVQIVAGDRNEPAQAIGTWASYFAIRRLRFVRGNVWTDGQESLKAKVCVIGASLAERMFGARDPIGLTIRVGRTPCTVTGVLASRGANVVGEDQDMIVLMPIGSFRARIRHTSPGQADELVVAAKSAAATERAKKQINDILRQRHRVRWDSPPDFNINGQPEIQALEKAVVAALSALLLCVAGISLLVGGIGVMNIMLVSVAERTREIGVRISIGAQARDILGQFLVEAIVLSSLGGALGLLLGAGVSQLIGWKFGMHLVPDGTSVLVAVGTSVAIGVIFGYLPARRAAAIDPIQALRAD